MKPYYYFDTFLAIPTRLFVANVVLAIHITRALVSRKPCGSNIFGNLYWRESY